MNKKEYQIDLGGQTIKFTISDLAGRANAAVLAQMGETVVLAACVMLKQGKEDIDYLPLSVDYEERFYAAGKIKGSRFVKREGRPSDEAILTGRLIDRALRPRFNQKIRNNIQIIITVLSYDEQNDPDILALNAASLALMISDIPWAGPVAGLKIGQVENELIINPTNGQKEKSLFSITVAGIQDKINMLEIKAAEAPEDKILEALTRAQVDLEKICQWQTKIQQEIGKTKADLPLKETDNKLVEAVRNFSKNQLEEIIYSKETSSLNERILQLKDNFISHLETENKLAITTDKKILSNEILGILEEEIDRIVHDNVIKSDKRPDGRKLNEIRTLACQVGYLPRTHGTGLFFRGNTQALSVVTLGSPGKRQMLETMEIEGEKHFIHHYNFPPFSVGETGFMRGPGRREIGHGALAEKALEAIIPNQESFPYTIRVVSEILSSNGSSSMASVCASSLALMDAGVPIKKPAAGIALGLILGEKNNYKILTDIQGPEDHHGDMDLKVAGTSEGITAAQMDVKIEGLNIEILKDAFAHAKEARLKILAEITKTIAAPRSELSPYAPIISTLQINPERIRDVIGPGGKIINQIIDETGVEIDIEDSGLVFVTSKDKIATEKAVEWIKNLTHEIKVGEIFQGRVTRILNFGAMVEIFPNQEGLIHISQLANHRVEKVSDILKIGDIVPVLVKEIDDLGRVNLSMKDVKNNNRNSSNNNN